MSVEILFSSGETARSAIMKLMLCKANYTDVMPKNGSKNLKAERPVLETSHAERTRKL